MEDGTITRNVFGISSKSAEGMSFRANGGDYNIMTPQEAKLIGKKTGKKLDEYTPGTEPPTETTEVKKIKLTTPLDDGSANDGSGGLQKGIVLEKNYTFEVESYTNKAPKNLSSIKWVMKYHSLKDNSWKERELNAKGNRITITFNEPDICGRFFHLKAYIISKESVEFEKTWHHNRYRFFDKKTVHEQAAQRASDPWRIDQGNTSLCGMAALFYVLAKKDGAGYENLAKELFRTGEATYNGYTLKPHDKALDMYNENPAGKDHPSLPQVDWICMATLRSKESSFFGQAVYKGKKGQDFEAINWPTLMKPLGKSLLGFSEVEMDYYKVNKSYLRDFFGSDEKLRILKEDIDRDYRNGYNICLLVDGSMLENDASYSMADFQEYHWIVYEGGLQMLNSGGTSESDFDDVATIKFNIFTWGENIQDISRKGTGISKDAFRSNYYGYLKLK